VVECAREEIFRMIGISVAAEVEGDYVESCGQLRCDVVPPMRVGSAAVEQDEGGMRGVPPEEGVKVDSAEARSREASALRIHGLDELSSWLDGAQCAGRRWSALGPAGVRRGQAAKSFQRNRIRLRERAQTPVHGGGVVAPEAMSARAEAASVRGRFSKETSEFGLLRAFRGTFSLTPMSEGL
jgi:hypothetical protein